MTKKAMHRCHRLIIGSLVSVMLFAVIAVSAQTEEPPGFALTWGSSGSGDGQFADARRLIADPEGNVLVTDYTNLCIQKFSPMGEFVQKFIPG